jgi:hypothetical protein
MASKVRYWKCVDCNSMINDKNMRTPRNWEDVDVPLYAEFCVVCYVYNPEVVIAYA